MDVEDPNTQCGNIKKAKISRVLQKFLEPNFKIKNDVYLNLFLTHLVGKSGGKFPSV